MEFAARRHKGPKGSDSAVRTQCRFEHRSDPLVLGYATLETRRVFQEPAIGWDLPSSAAEYYAYSAVWLLLGLALLAYGLRRMSKEARWASALSFLGLGAALIGIGLVNQHVVFARPKPLTPQS